MATLLTPAQQAYRSMTNASSSLLQLPQEIKYHIYGYVFIPQMVHIYTYNDSHEHRSGNTLYHRRCQCPPEYLTAQRAERERRFGSSPPWYESPTFHQDWCTRKTNTFKLDLRFLDTCLQINAEARRVLYTNTTFSFDGWAVVDIFIKKIPQQLLSDIRSTRLEVDCSSDLRLDLWNRTMLSAAEVLKSLTHIHLDMKQRWFMPGAKFNERALTTGLWSLARLPLKEVTVNAFEERCKVGDPSGRWGKVTMEMLSTWVRGQLLHPDQSYFDVEEQIRCLGVNGRGGLPLFSHLAATSSQADQ